MGSSAIEYYCLLDGRASEYYKGEMPRLENASGRVLRSLRMLVSQRSIPVIKNHRVIPVERVRRSRFHKLERIPTATKTVIMKTDLGDIDVYYCEELLERKSPSLLPGSRFGSIHPAPPYSGAEKKYTVVADTDCVILVIPLPKLDVYEWSYLVDLGEYP